MDQLQTVHGSAWHVDVGEDDRDFEVSFELAYRVIGMSSFVHRVPSVLYQLNGAHADEGLILYD